MALASIAQDVQEFSKKLGLSADLKVIEHAWRVELGGLREFARIVAVDKASLVVEVDSHAVMQELSLRRRELVRKLNKHLPAPFIEHLTVRISQNNGR